MNTLTRQMQDSTSSAPLSDFLMSPLPSSRERVMLGLLHSVGQNSARSQRTMAEEFGVALGVINATLRYCVRKGYVKVKRVPARRYAYFLTPKGIAEKT